MFSGCMYVAEWLGYGFALGSVIRCCVLIAAWRGAALPDSWRPKSSRDNYRITAAAVIYRCVINTTSAWICLLFEFFVLASTRSVFLCKRSGCYVVDLVCDFPSALCRIRLNRCAVLRHPDEI